MSCTPLFGFGLRTAEFAGITTTIFFIPFADHQGPKATYYHTEEMHHLIF
jgi:hypothetical protein